VGGVVSGPIVSVEWMCGRCSDIERVETLALGEGENPEAVRKVIPDGWRWNDRETLLCGHCAFSNVVGVDAPSFLPEDES
jgi:hypothetical protein